MPKPSSHRIPVPYLPGEGPSDAQRVANAYRHTSAVEPYYRNTPNERQPASDTEHLHSHCHRRPHGPDDITWRYAGDWSHAISSIASTASISTYSTAQSDDDDASSFFSACDAFVAVEASEPQKQPDIPATRQLLTKEAPPMESNPPASPSLQAFRRVISQIVPQYFKRRNV